MEINKISNETIFRLLAVATAFLIFLAILTKLTVVIIWVLTAFLLTVVLTPVIKWLATKMPKKSRGLAITLTYITIFLVVGFLTFSLVPLAITQSVEIVKHLPAQIQNFLSTRPAFARFISAYFPHIGDRAKMGQYLSRGVDFVFTQTAKIFGSVAAAFTIFTVSIYMSLEGPTVVKRFFSLFEGEKSVKVGEIASKMYNIVIKYIMANLATALLAGFGAAIMLWIFKVPNILFLAILITFLDLVPMIGVWIIAGILVGMGYLYGGVWPAVIMAVYSLLYAQFEYSYLEPVIYGRATNISPLTIIIAVLIGGSLAGILGLFIAVPVAACIQVLVVEYWQARKTPAEPSLDYSA